MPLLPQDPFAIAGLALILGALGFLLARRDWPKAYGIGLLMLAVFALDTVGRLNGSLRGPHPLGFRAADIVSGQGWWEPITSIFVHADLFHLIGNLFILVTAGPALEDRIGSKRFLLIFFLAAIAAMVAQVILAYTTAITFPQATAVGASGGIFGILTAFAIRYPRERLPVPLIFIIWIPAFIVLVIYMLFNVGYALSDTNVAWWGHFAGFLTGFGFAYTLPHADPQAGQKGSTRGLPDASRLEPLATTPNLKRIHERLRQFTPETRTHDDTQYAQAWLDQFFDQAQCPTCAGPLTRKGLTATCAQGHYKLDFQQSKK